MRHKMFAIVSASVFAGFSGFAAPAVAQGIPSRIQQAEQALEAGKNVEAIANATAVLKENPGSVQALAIRGIAEENIEKYADAAEDVNAALLMAPNAAFLHVLHCSALYHLHRLDEAIAACTKAIQIDPHNVGAYDDRALAHDAKDDMPNETLALADVDKSIALDPKSSWPWSERCELKIELHREADRADADCDRALMLAPHDGWTWYQRGVLYSFAHDYVNAERAFQRAIDEKTSLGYAYVRLGQAQSARGKYAQAVDSITTYIEKAPSVPDGYIARAEVEEKNHQGNAAIADAQKALSLKSSGKDENDVAGRAKALLLRLAPIAPATSHN